MKITIQENSNARETEIIVVCKELTSELEEIISSIALSTHTIAGSADGEIYFLPLKDIYYFEAVENKIFFYTKDRTFESNIRLYQLEEKLQSTTFARVSKSAIVNLKKIKSIRPDENSRLIATLLSNEKIMVSRSFVHEIKKKLGV
ncbi:MAG: LytTR family transcriptional regulator DNA-binding domain-containing protein [Clostridia bacterium]|nr:LytTR family transcriptional regulator DNA-binding domain-containing protein [Clostridia bacterium]